MSVQLRPLSQSDKDLINYNKQVSSVLSGHQDVIHTINSDSLGAKLKRKGNSPYCYSKPQTDVNNVSSSVWKGVSGFFRVPFTSCPCSMKSHDAWHNRVGINLGEAIGRKVESIATEGLLEYYKSCGPDKKEFRTKSASAVHSIAVDLLDPYDLGELTEVSHPVIIPEGKVMMNQTAQEILDHNDRAFPLIDMSKVRSTEVWKGMRGVLIKHHLTTNTQLRSALSAENNLALDQSKDYWDKIIISSFQLEHAEMLEDLEAGHITMKQFSRRKENLKALLRHSGNSHLVTELRWETVGELQRRASNLFSSEEETDVEGCESDSSEVDYFPQTASAFLREIVNEKDEEPTDPLLGISS